MVKRYHIHLSDDQRTALEQVISRGKTSARVITRAHILLKAAEGWHDKEMEASLPLSRRGTGDWYGEIGRSTGADREFARMRHEVREAKAHKTPKDQAGCTRENGISEARTPEGRTVCQRLRNLRSE